MRRRDKKKKAKRNRLKRDINQKTIESAQNLREKKIDRIIH